jgi:hypothetical protein
LRATVLDREPVLVKTREHVARAGLADRIETRPVNLFGEALPRADAAVISSVLHDFSPDRARAILRAVHDALGPGAPLWIMEIVPDDARAGPPLPVAFALTMIVNTEGGDAHTAAQYESWLRETGFEPVRRIPLDGRLVTMAIQARRR